MLAYMIGIAQSANDYIQIANGENGTYQRCLIKIFGWKFAANQVVTKIHWRIFAGDSIDIHDITPSLMELIELNIVFSVWIWYRWIELAELFPKMVKSLQTGWWLQRYRPKWEEKHWKANVLAANAPQHSQGMGKRQAVKILAKKQQTCSSMFYFRVIWCWHIWLVLPKVLIIISK